MGLPEIRYEAKTKEEFSGLEEAMNKLIKACDINVESSWTQKGVVVSGSGEYPIITPIEHSTITSVTAKNDDLKLVRHVTDHFIKVKVGELQYTINYNPK